MSGSERDRRLEELERENRRLREELAQGREEIERLRRLLEEALRAPKRQAAPHSRGKLKAKPKRPGRKPGKDYGQHRRRPIPERVDQQIAVELPPRCQHCQGEVEFLRTLSQYQEDIVRRTVVRQFDVAVGRCCDCGCRVQGRHPLQTSDALGAAQVQVGPEALALAAQLNKPMGLSLGHTVEVLQLGFGLELSRGCISRALARLAEKAQPTYEGLLETARQSLVNRVDETGWRVGGRRQWMWTAVSDQVTLYMILPGRGFREAARLLGEDYSGWLLHDGLRCYYGFKPITPRKPLLPRNDSVKKLRSLPARRFELLPARVLR